MAGPREQRPPSSSLIIHSHEIRAVDADSTGTLDAGFLLEMVDKCAAACANRFSGLMGSCVTASMDSIAFLSPARLGDVLVIRGVVNRSWGTSMEVGLLIENENLASGTRRLLSRAYLTMVGTKDGKPHPVPELVPETEIERRRWGDAGKRRQERLAEPKIPPRTMQLGPTSRGTPAERRPKPDAAAWLVEICFPGQANNNSVLFGGILMRWMLAAASLAAARFARFPVVAAEIDRVSFLTPIKIGDVVYVRSFVSRTWKHSIECYTSVAVLKMGSDGGSTTQTLVPSNDGFAVFVARDSSQNLIKVPPIRSFRDEERRQRYEGGEERRRLRLQQRAELREHARTGWTDDDEEQEVEVAPPSKPRL
ncbi:HotDog domain-containing protein [Hyaloraphidium curvatum]|nr:HotDog domain-containing protein [Hyaloraphidium curvatum]